jgi:DNA-binding NarL/FixJ family response regulator
MKHRICLAEDHAILRDGLKALLASDDSVEVVAEAADGLALVERVQEHQPDLVILDLSMPRLNGLQAIEEIKRRRPAIKILVLTMHNTEEHILASLQAGAHGYLLKDSTQAELLLAIRAVMAGKSYLSPEVSQKVLRDYLEGKKAAVPASPWETLTHRERETLQLIAEGYKNKDIAACLHMSVKTVETHRTNLMKKLDLHSVSALTTYAIEKGLVTK